MMRRALIALLLGLSVLLPAVAQAQDPITLAPRSQDRRSSYALSAAVVAASDAPQLVKSRAGWVCDGTNDEVQIQAAIDSGVKVVYLSQGNFVAQDIKLDEGVQLRGAGVFSTKISLPASATAAMFACDAQTSWNGGGIFDMELYGDAGKTRNGIDFSSSTAIYEFFIERCKLSYFAVGLQGAAAGTNQDRFLCVTDTDIWYCTTGANLTEHPRLSNVDFRSCTTGLEVDFSHCQVNFCKFTYNVDGVKVGSGDLNNFSEFENCVFYNNSGTSLELTRWCNVANCLFLGNEDNASSINIRITGSGRNSIIGNIFGGSGYHSRGGHIVFDYAAAVIYGGSITGNQFYIDDTNSSNTAILAASGCNQIYGMACTGNAFHFYDPGVGIDLRESSRVAFSTFNGNSFIFLDTTGPQYGIQIDATNAWGNVFANNTFGGPASATAVGMELDARNSVITGNHFYNVGTPLTLTLSDTGTKCFNNPGSTNDPMDRVLLQGAPASIADGDTAITAANVLTGICTMASSTSGRAPTVPTGTAVNGVILIGQYIDWSFINTGNQTVTITAATGHTLVGAMAIPAGKSGAFRTRCSAANTAITYRMDGG
jgi:hypothetical protein